MTEKKALQLRLPGDLKDWIAEQAKRNGASQNSEIIRAVRDRMDRVQKEGAA
ncbi:DNA-binding protein [Thioclava dalianensis]|uniref:DNA-binding protein n=1 Tax=Thioclava dalianensis TaxID=1185766 RepID=A0A074THK4_9RHOB|nr:Arc family DNA-binding protein [Thioclava dalianensis]KEP68518.1 DNA-binding protein [Thioclava dalianensis]SFN84401.1 Arc-like DNA binding domain-containing protein [Thioclava dalianensis]